jgi:exopolyphosphatase / guanosine-5'-triphosphate,3'-diphosphate pyrophosphatase
VSDTGGASVAAAIDVGSNSVLLLVVAVPPDGRARAVDEATATTRLGAGLVASGALDAAAVRRTRGAVVDFAEHARRAGATRIWAFATGAARRASDGVAFAAGLARDARLPVEILDGECEAILAYAAVAHGLGLDDTPVLVADVGGATTELVLGHGASVVEAVSLPIGALGLTEAGGDDAAARAREVARGLAATDLPARARAAGARLAASGGTATALGALALGLRRYEPARVHGTTVAIAALPALVGSATSAGGALDPARAAILPAGACILDAVARAAGSDAILVSDHGVRHAYLRAQLGRTVTMRTLWD